MSTAKIQLLTSRSTNLKMDWVRFLSLQNRVRIYIQYMFFTSVKRGV